LFNEITNNFKIEEDYEVDLGERANKFDDPDDEDDAVNLENDDDKTISFKTEAHLELFQKAIPWIKMFIDSSDCTLENNYKIHHLSQL